MAKVKIVREWKGKRNFTFGQDVNGNLYAKCGDCNKNAVILNNYKDGKIIKIVKCLECNKRLKI